MKTIKVGQINFWTDDYWGSTGEMRIRNLLDYFNKFSNKYNYEYCDCLIDNCDIVFYSLYDHINNLNKCKGNPLFIYWTDEYSGCGADEIFENPFKFYKRNNLSISFYEDSDDNCYFPYGFLDYDNVIYMFNKYEVNIKDKSNFCTFCASNENLYGASYRTKFVKYINKNYKNVTCCGKVLNNTNNIYLPLDLDSKINYHYTYKFNLCFENESSGGTKKYITEKIINAFIYKTIPIYWGCKNINDFFNKDAFINCNGLTYKEMLNKIIEVDTNDELYNYMIHQYPFKYKSINYKEYLFERILQFIEINL